jgi:hypothetical protein
MIINNKALSKVVAVVTTSVLSIKLSNVKSAPSANSPAAQLNTAMAKLSPQISSSHQNKRTLST